MRTPVRRIFCLVDFIVLWMIVHPGLPAVAADAPARTARYIWSAWDLATPSW